MDWLTYFRMLLRLVGEVLAWSLVIIVGYYCWVVTDGFSQIFGG